MVLVGSGQGGNCLVCNTIYNVSGPILVRVGSGWRGEIFELYMIYNVFYVLRTIRRAAEGEPPRLEGGVPVHRKTLTLVASTVSHSPAFPR